MRRSTDPAPDRDRGTQADQRRVARARAVARLLDESVRVPGTRFRIGFDPILGMLPYVGDGVASIGSLYVVYVGARLGLPPRALAKMSALVVLDFVAGSVPVIGSVVDAALKVNVRNVAAIEAHAEAD